MTEAESPDPTERPSHHGPDGRFRNPWPLGQEAPRSQGDLLKWAWQRWRSERAPDPAPEELPRATPDLGDPAAGGAPVRVTWVGHATFLLQLPGVTLLTDPVFSRRASPVQWAGPKRFSPPGLALEDLPPVDAVLLSHDHYDHLDRPTVLALRDRFGDRLTWYTPLRYEPWFARLGVERVEELDWWQEAVVRTERGTATVQALPARHWTRRRLFDARRRLWCSWSVTPAAGDAASRRIYFGGDSGYGPGFEEIRQRTGGCALALLPVGAYEPRWFMKPSHMNPEEAVQAFRDVGAEQMVAMHWGTFRLTDEPPLEPPARTRRAWEHLGLPASDLHIPALGETLRF